MCCHSNISSAKVQQDNTLSILYILLTYGIILMMTQKFMYLLKRLRLVIGKEKKFNNYTYKPKTLHSLIKECSYKINKILLIIMILSKNFISLNKEMFGFD